MSAAEIQRLRVKFIAISMLSIFLAMTFIGFTVNVVTYSISRISIDHTLSALIDNAEGAETARRHEYRMSFSDIFSPEYERNVCYTFFYDGNGNLLRYHSNLQDDSETELVLGYAETILNGPLRNGLYRGYFFKRVRLDGGETAVALLEGSLIRSMELRFIYLTLILCSLGLLITYFLVRRFSSYAVQPEIENSIRQKQFITNASHELKTPLAVIRANTEMIEMTGGESEWTQATLKQVDHLNGLIQNLVMIARSQEREDRSELSEIDAAKAVSECADAYEPMAAQTGKTILREIDPAARITMDESKLRQLAALLIDNAMKYCDEGGTIRISLLRMKGGRGLQFSVANDYAQGAGMDCSRFFDRFYRADPSHNIDRGGYGIGLSIAESICRQYGGSIGADWKNGVIRFVCILR